MELFDTIYPDLLCPLTAAVGLVALVVIEVVLRLKRRRQRHEDGALPTSPEGLRQLGQSLSEASRFESVPPDSNRSPQATLTFGDPEPDAVILVTERANVCEVRAVHPTWPGAFHPGPDAPANTWTLDAAPAITLIRRRPLHTWTRAFGLGTRLRTGDRHFDQRFVATCTGKDAVMLAAFADPTVRETILQTSELFETIRLYGPRTPIELATITPTLQPDALTAALAAVRTLADHLPAVTVEAPKRSAGRLLASLGVGLVVVSLLLAATASPFLFAVALEDMNLLSAASPMLSGAVLGLALALPILALALWRGRGRAEGPTHMLVALWITLPLALTAPAAALIHHDVTADASSSTPHDATVLRRFTHGDEGPLRYILAVSTTDGHTQRVSVDRSLWEQTSPGTRVVLHVKDGALGWPHVAEVTIASAPVTP